MKKLPFYCLILVFITSCNSVKRIADGKHLLTENIIYIDSVKYKDTDLNKYLLQKPNTKAIGVPLSLYFYNLGNKNKPKTPIEWAEKNPKSYNFIKSVFSEKQAISYAKSFIGLNNWYLKNGEAPSIISDRKTKATVKNLRTYFTTIGYFNTKITSKKNINNKTKKGTIEYHITKGNPLYIDTIKPLIDSYVLDSIYNAEKKHSKLKRNQQYNEKNFIAEAERLTKLFRNKGVYHFNINSIGYYDVDSTSTDNKTDVELEISDRIIERDGMYGKKPYKAQRIKKINVFTDYSFEKREETYNEQKNYNGINFLAHHKLRYNPKFLSQSIFIKPNEYYSDSLRNLSLKHLRGLKNFKSTSIKFSDLNDDELEANIFLTPKEKYTLGFEAELSRSNIRFFDISTKFSILNRNTFRGAELFKFGISSSYFNSNNGAGWELGGEISLEVPRFMAPFGIHKMVPKRMSPRTKYAFGTNLQKNIGLDRQNYNLLIDYKWNFSPTKTIQLEVLNAQYIRNLNVADYFNVYRSEYAKLYEVSAQANYTLESTAQANSFMIAVANDSQFKRSHPNLYTTNLNVLNRYRIITSNFLIPEIAYNFTFNNQQSITDKSFSFFKLRIANSGSILDKFSNTENSLGQKTLFEIPLAQYFKTDFEYKKFWDTGENSLFGFRSYLGVLIPYNGSNLPFSKSYFAGGSNDIRAWRTYDLGPGKRPQGLEYNTGSLKFLASAEYRFDMIGNLKGALFTDLGNIWDITGSKFVEESAKFNNLSSLKDIAVGAGFGVRYDFKFLVARLDLAFKIHEPYLSGNRWLRNANFSNSVLNIGINYPF